MVVIEPPALGKPSLTSAQSENIRSKPIPKRANEVGDQFLPGCMELVVRAV